MIRKLFTVVEEGELFTKFCIPVRKYFLLAMEEMQLRNII